MSVDKPRKSLAAVHLRPGYSNHGCDSSGINRGRLHFSVAVLQAGTLQRVVA